MMKQLKMTMCLFVSILALVFLGQVQSAAAEQMDTSQLAYNIEAQSLKSALEIYQKTSDLNLAYSDKLVEGKMTDGVCGKNTTVQALTKILKDTGLTYTITNQGTVVLMGNKLVVAQRDVEGKEVYQIGEITVQALGEKQLKRKKQKEPAMKEIITQSNIEKMSDVKTAWDVLRSMPGLTVKDFQGGAIGGPPKLSIRGAGFLFWGNSYAVFLDDVPITEAGEYHGNADLSCIPVDSIDHVEVIKGPFSTDSGDFNILGVIKFYTKKLDDRNNITLEGGSYGYNRDAMTLSKEIDDLWRLFATGEFKRQDGYTNNSAVDHLVNGRANITYGHPGKSQMTLSLGVSDYDVEDPCGLNLDQYNEGDYKAVWNDTDGRDKSQYDASLNLDWVINDSNNWVNLFWYRKVDYKRWEDVGNIWFWPAPGHDQCETSMERGNFGYRSKYRMHGDLMGRPTSLTLGFDYRRDDIKIDKWKTEYREKTQRSDDADIVYDAFGVYGNLDVQIFDAFKVYLGLRWDSIEYDCDDHLTPEDSKDWSLTDTSPKVGLTYALTDSVLFFAQFATGHSTPNPLYMPEEKMTESRNYESGFKGHLFDGRLEFLASGFYWETEDWPLRYRNDLGVWVTEFVGETESVGFEIGLKVHLVDWLTYFVDYGWNDTRFKGHPSCFGCELDDMAGSDPWNLATGFDWNYDFGRSNRLSGRLEYLVDGRGWENFDYDRKEEYYHNVRLKVNYDFLEKYRAFFNINNLLNEKGKCPWPYPHYYRPEPGVTFNAGLKFYF